MTNNNHPDNTDDNYIAEIEEGVMEASDPATNKTRAKNYNRLSFISQKYDIDGDGVLDAAELASKLQLLVSLHNVSFSRPTSTSSHYDTTFVFLTSNERMDSAQS